MAYVAPSTLPTDTMVTSTHVKVWVNNQKFFHGQPTAMVTLNAAAAVTQSTWFDVSFDTENWDTNAMWSSTAPTKVFCKTAGKFVVHATGGVVASTNGTVRGIGVRKNSTSGNPDFYAMGRDAPSASLPSFPAVSQMIALSTGQYLQLVLYHDHTTTLNTSTAAGTRPQMSVLWVSS